MAGLGRDLRPGSRVLIDDGLIELTVDYITDKGEIHTTVKSGGRVSNRKGVNVPGVHLTLPFLSEADKQDLLFGIETGFDFVAASFVRTAEDVGEMRRFLEEHGRAAASRSSPRSRMPRAWKTSTRSCGFRTVSW